MNFVYILLYIINIYIILHIYYYTILHGDNMITKEEFNKFAHEVKNPLAVCSGYLEMISKCNEKDRIKTINEIKATPVTP